MMTTTKDDSNYSLMEFKIIDRMPETFLFFGFENYKEVE